MILFFSYFWVATQFNELQIADDMKKSGGYIPGVRPGQATSNFLHRTMSRITLAGAIFLTVIAVIPIILNSAMDAFRSRFGAVFWRHQSAHHCRCHARHHAPDGIASAHAPLRRLPEERPPQGTILAAPVRRSTFRVAAK
jgi:hypothetical protein